MGAHKLKKKLAENTEGAEKVGAERPARQTISVALIVKNEELTLERILGAASLFADELIVVDTGSTDKTKEIAAKFSAQVYEFEWCDDFAAARNYAFSKCTKDWIMWLDADDVLTRESLAAVEWVRREVLTKANVRTVFCPYHYEYDEHGNLAVNLNRERILRNHIGHKWIGRIHETLENPWPDSVRCDKPIVEHRPVKVQLDRKKSRNLKIFEQYIDIETDSLRELFLYGSELQQNQRSLDAVKVFKKYLERAGDKNDLVGEKYSVYMKLADTFFNLKRFNEAMTEALACIRLDPTRAEGYTLAGAINYFGGYPLAAWPFLVAATQCALPAPTTSLIVYKLYSDVPMQLMCDCLKAMKTKGPLDRMRSISAGMFQLMKKVKFEDNK